MKIAEQLVQIIFSYKESAKAVWLVEINGSTTQMF